MSSDPTAAREDIICRCSGTTQEQIRRYVEKGVADLDGISRASGACSGCGGCESDLLTLIAELEKSRAEPVPE
jgi:bacterioferritin-associated ferredoxin